MVYVLRMVNTCWANVDFDPENNVLINNKKLLNTHGIYELLFKKLFTQKTI